MALALAVFAGVVQWWLVRDLRQLPSPIFGGDWTYQEACIRSILVSSNPLASPISGDALPGYMPLYGSLVAAIIRLTGLGVEEAMLVMSMLNHVVCTLVVFAVISRHFGRRAGLAMTCLWQWAFIGLIVRYTEFTAQILVPLYFDALLLWVRAPRVRHALYLGLVLAVLGYAHAVAFIGGIAIAGAAMVLSAWLRRGERGWRAESIAAVQGLAVVAACSLLALGYWYRPIAVFHGRTSPHYAEWNGGEAVGTLVQRLGFAGRLIARSFPVADAPSAVLSGLTVLGVVALLTSARRGRRPVALVSALTFGWMFHFLLTVPLLHTHFVPDYVRRMLWAFASLLLASVAAGTVLGRVPAGRAWRTAALALLVLAGAGIAARAGALSRDQAMVAARTPLPSHMRAMQQWVLANTRPDDVVLSTNELSFAWCALTGRKAFVSRRAQNDPFLDLDARNRDAAHMLYGRDDARRLELLRRSHITYLFWTHQWESTEYVTLPGGVGRADPLMYFTNPAFDDELRGDSVVVVPDHGWVDSYLRGAEFPQFDFTLIAPENYVSPDHPWSRRLDAFLEPAWEYRENGVRLAALYRVRADRR